MSYIVAQGALSGEKNDQGGKLCLLLGDDGEAHTQSVVQVNILEKLKLRKHHQSVQALWPSQQI